MTQTNGNAPPNIKHSWWVGLTARLQQAACSQNGFAVVSIQVLVDREGNPVMWSDPRVTRLEPLRRGSEFMESLISSMQG